MEREPYAESAYGVGYRTYLEIEARSGDTRMLRVGHPVGWIVGSAIIHVCLAIHYGLLAVYVLQSEREPEVYVAAQVETSGYVVFACPAFGFGPEVMFYERCPVVVAP